VKLVLFLLVSSLLSFCSLLFFRFASYSWRFGCLIRTTSSCLAMSLHSRCDRRRLAFCVHVTPASCQSCQGVERLVSSSSGPGAPHTLHHSPSRTELVTEAERRQLQRVMGELDATAAGDSDSDAAGATAAVGGADRQQRYLDAGEDEEDPRVRPEAPADDIWDDGADDDDDGPVDEEWRDDSGHASALQCGECVCASR
jgi:hypothetical protein